MPHEPQRRGPKIGRNDPCPCGNGRKFKHCHGRPAFELPNLLLRADVEKQIIAEGRRLFERHKVRELQRKKQQGLGRPIISIEHKDYRFVAVANRVLWGKWKTFPDFLRDYIKMTLGADWGNAEIAKPLEQRHPLLQWYDKLCKLQAAHAKEPGALYSMPVTGAVSAYHRLAYNLYLIAHNGKDIQTRLIARLKNKDNFQGAFFETRVAAWLIRAGFELEYEDEADRTSTHCEFTATYKLTGEQYSVEAKSRELESTHASRAKVGRKLYDALAKKANHKRLIFLDLNKPLHTREAADSAIERAERIVSRSEGMTINGQPAPPAYVCITNMNDQYVLDNSSLAMAVSFRGFKIGDFMGVQFASIREAVRARERHWPMFQLLKSIEQHRDIPQTFSGELPSEVFPKDKRPRLQVGNFYLVPGPDGRDVEAQLENATVMDSKAYAVLHDPVSEKRWMGTFEMTKEELADYEKYRETYFGVLDKSNGGNLETAIDMFDWLFDVYRETPKEKLLEFMSTHPDRESLAALSQIELAEILCERYVMHMVAQGFAVKPPRSTRRPAKRSD